MKILFTGGGTAGHIMPIIAIARELRSLYQESDLELHYIGPKDEHNLSLLSSEKFKIHTIISGKIRRYFSFQNITDILFKLPTGFIQSFFLLLFIKPKLIFSKGGSGSIVVCMSAKILKIPVFLHESDSVPGLSNQKVSAFAKKIFISFEKTEYFDITKTILSGNPIREDLLKEDSKVISKEVLGLTMEKPILLIIGGSQGAEAINEFIMVILNDLLKQYEIIHVTGAKNFSKTKIESHLVLNNYLEKYYHLYPSLDETQLQSFYKSADLIISRAGAGTIFEIAALGKPSILVPLPKSASDHQLKNAYQYSKTGAALVIEQKNLTPNFFWQEVNYLFSNPELLKKMTDSALKFAKPKAAEIISKEILEYLKK